MTAYIVTPVGRLVGGHPMVSHEKLDANNQPKLNRLGNKIFETWFNLAIQKGAEAHWAHTEWGKQLWNVGQTAWQQKLGDLSHLHDFSWKVEDGDDATVSVKRATANKDREGYAGHWIIKCSHYQPVSCFYTGKFQPHLQIMDENEIKCGDYIRTSLVPVSNNSADSPGIYLNPKAVEVVRAGKQIIIQSGPPVEEMFGNAPQLPTNMIVDDTPQSQTSVSAPPPPAQTSVSAPPPPAQTSVSAPPPPPPPPAAPAIEGFANAVPKKYVVQGHEYTADQLLAIGWSPEQIEAL